MRTLHKEAARACARRWLAFGAGCAALFTISAHAEDAADLADRFARLSLAELGEIEVTSVSKRPERLREAAAAIHVITGDDLRRSGVNSLPDALRLAPNLQVGRITGLNYAVSARGFNSLEASNKLLVLIDGRSVYSSLHSGVFWDFHDVMLEDVERIEVVSGPGGTLWGANAVNGVINVITRRPAESLGGLVSAGIGTLDRDIAARYGGAVGDKAAYRVYVKAFERGPTVNAAGVKFPDDWDRFQGGVVAEWTGARDSVRIQGDIFESAFEDFPSDISGGNALIRWSHTFGNGTPLNVQAYYDRTHRIAPPGIDETVNVYDLDLQHTFEVGERHAIVWGGGYRSTRSSFANATPFELVNRTRALDLANVFIQDEISLSPRLTLTAGLKLEDHEYTGLEYLPNVRVAWQVRPDTLLWAAVSRAVRTPSRIDRELISRAPGFFGPSPDFDSESLVAYEAGVRAHPAADLSLAVAAFYNVYDDLRATARPPGGGPARFVNAMQGHTYGVEASGIYNLAEWWRVSASVNVLRKSLHIMPGVNDFSNMQAGGNDPDVQYAIRTQINPVADVEIDAGLRGVDELPRPLVPAYVELDARLAWRATDTVELSVAGFNLLDAHHPEVGVPATRREVRRAVQGRVHWVF